MNIGLDITIDDAYARGIARGIIRYGKIDKNWNILGSDWMFASHAGEKLDGIISRIENQVHTLKLQQFNVPVVDVAGAWQHNDFFEVHNDDYETGKMAGRYLVSLGHEHFAWAGVSKVQWSKYRFEGYSNELTSKTHTLGKHVFEKDLDWWENLDLEISSLCAWLENLQKPTAIFAANDTVGLKITKACTAANIEVPKDFAILGVDNEDILCELANPSLSSIRVDCELMGFKAAELLDNLIHPTGKNFQNLANQVVSPLNIIERESTKIAIAKDALVEKALNFIKNRAHTGIDVTDILKEVPISRRSLEQKFFNEIGKTLHEEIIANKIEYSKVRLKETNSSLDAIAHESGFGSLQRFHSQFKKLEKITPGEWRKNKL